jgi:hypothetical protein
LTKAIKKRAEYKSIITDDREKLMIDLTILQKSETEVLENEMPSKWSASVNEYTRHNKEFAINIQPTVKLMKKAYQLHSSENLQVLYAKNEGLHYIGNQLPVSKFCNKNTKKYKSALIMRFMYFFPNYIMCY